MGDTSQKGCAFRSVNTNEYQEIQECVLVYTFSCIHLSYVKRTESNCSYIYIYIKLAVEVQNI